MGRKRGWRKNNWARSVSPEQEESSPEPWDEDEELTYEDHLAEQPYLGPYPIHHHAYTSRYHTPYSHPYYRHPTPDPAHDLVPVLKNLDYTSSILATQNRRWLFLDALRKATGRIECWWPELRDDGALKMEWKPEQEVVIPIPERELGYSWGSGRPERVVVVDLLDWNLDFDALKNALGLGLGGRWFGGLGGGKGGGDKSLGEDECDEGKKEEVMDIKCEKEEKEDGRQVRMSDIPVYCPSSPPPTTMAVDTRDTTPTMTMSAENPVYGFEEMMKWISGKQGPEVVEEVGGGGEEQVLQMTRVGPGDDDLDYIL